jgi:ribonuclease HI
MNPKSLKIYCDGACSGNPGPGGWGAVLIWGEEEKHISGFEPNTTNNRMELMAAIKAIREIKRQVSVDIYVDSSYVQQGITNWIKKWKQNNWNHGKVKNIDLWRELDEVAATYEIRWHWVRGHNGDKYNEIADQLAVAAIKSARR